MDNTDSIKPLLADIRNNGIKNPQYIRKLLAKLTEKNDWSDEECRHFYEVLLRKYIKNAHDLNVMLAVSGIDEKYGGPLKTASKRRENYFEYLKANDPTEKRSDVDSLRRNEEEQCLNYIAEKLEEVIKNGESSELVERLILGEEEMKNTKENAKDVEKGVDSQNQQSALPYKQNDNTLSNVLKNFSKNVVNFGSFNINVVNGNQDNSETRKNKGNRNKMKNKISLKTFLIIGVTVGVVGGYGVYYATTHSTQPPVENIALPPGEVILKPSTYYEIKPYITPEESSNASLSYTSEDPEVATVSRKGIVLAQGKWEGVESRTTQITIQAENGITAKQPITVEKNYDDISPTTDVEDFDAGYTIQASVRFAGTTGKNWTDNLDVKIGDELEYQIAYINKSNDTQHHVVINDVLPTNLEYIPGSTKVWNGNHPDGADVNNDGIVDGGIDIGSYTAGSNAIVRFRAKVVDDNLADGGNMLVNWARGSIGDVVLQDYANVHLTKE
ncbi:MAG: DUF11 domain-containing protein [Lachnospiraceae bacterium]